MLHGEQTYCRKWIFDKMPKTVLGHNGEIFFQKYGLSTKRRFFSCFLLPVLSPTHLNL
jgi:hypothetical protein